MTEALKKDWEKTCQERIDEQWQQRQKDLRNNEFEPLGFDYVEPHTFTDQLEDTGVGSFPGAVLRTSCVHTLTRIKKSIVLNTGSWTGWTVLSWSCSQDQSGTRCRKWCIAHYELVDCLRFIIISCSVPAGDARGEGTVVACMRSALHRRQVRLLGLLVSIVQESQQSCSEVRVKKIKKGLTIKMKWDIKG